MGLQLYSLAIVDAVSRPIHVYSIPLRRRFRGIGMREGVLMHGAAGWGEFSPFREYDDAEAVAWWRAAKEAADLGWPEPLRDRVPVNATVPAVAAEDVADVLARFPGCTTAKVKVGLAEQSSGEDVERLVAVRAALGRQGKIRIDVNGAWDVATATRLLPQFDRAADGLEYAEQPCATVDDLARVRRKVDVPIAADESIRRAEDPLLVVKKEAADVAVLKVQPLGGVRAALDIAEQIGIPVVVSSALETSVGIAAGIALAAALPELPYACGLATVGLLTSDITDEPLVAEAGGVPVRAARPSQRLLNDNRAGDAVRYWWQQRGERVAAIVRMRGSDQ